MKRIERFGLEAVTGRRVLYYGELCRMITAENIVKAYTDRKESENWGKWGQDNPRLEAILIDAEISAND